MIRAIRRDPFPVRRVLDIGCGSGRVAESVCRALGVDAVGIDVNPPRERDTPIPIVRADAVHDPLPHADLAYSMYMGHHLTEERLRTMIRNVGRFCRRFILLDLVRHRLPLTLFRCFVAPFVSPVVSQDGCISIRRSYRPAELRCLTEEALAGSRATFRHSVTPFYTRQVVDIAYDGVHGRPKLSRGRMR